jgi:multicomponent Na+:H+ antiporter subunit E
MKRYLKIFAFVLFYIKEILISNITVARDVLFFNNHLKPGFILLPIDTLNERQILILSNIITMTPGTLAMDVADDQKNLFLHSLYVEDADQLRQQLIEDYVTPIRELF